MTADGDDRARHIRRVMAAEGENVRARAGSKNAERYRAIEDFPGWNEARDRARAAKEDAIERLPELIESVTAAVEANGGTVYLAEDATDANAYLADVVDEANAESVVKSKSMTTEEIDLNEHLETAGVDVWETDLGEFVIQLAGEDPSHIVGPAMHKSRAEIAELFEERFDPDRPLETPEDLTRFAREFLGERILDADVGVTGANFVLADSGSIVLVTNEGNARKCAVTPDVHVAVAGVEKLLPSVAELQPFVQLLARAATGQSASRYLSVLTPPTETPTMDLDADEWDVGDRSFHLVLLDNGRFDLREDDQLAETLYCIRCGACSNACANFQHAGGHVFGGETYSGGIATGWETGVHGTESAATFNDLCTGCTRCVDACPVKIDVPWINTVVRDRLNRGEAPDTFDHFVDGLMPDAEDPGTPLEKRFFGNVETVAKLGSATAPLSNWLASTRPVRVALERLVGLDRRRDLPTFTRESFVDWFEARGGFEASRRRAREAQATRASRSGAVDSRSSESHGGSGGANGFVREAVVYPDTYTNYVHPGRGKATVRTLEALGVAVLVPAIGESGRAPLSQGMVRTAEARARHVYDDLASHLDAGRPIVVIEPSDLAAFVRAYDRLLPETPARRLREAAVHPLELVAARLDGERPDGERFDGERFDDERLDGERPDSERFNGERFDSGWQANSLELGDGRRVAYHPHCQGRTVGVDRVVVAALRQLGYDVRVTDVECCGMAGSFGYKRSFFDLSVSVGSALIESVESLDADLIAAGGVSCADQLEQLGGVPVVHPIELVAPPAAEAARRG